MELANFFRDFIDVKTPQGKLGLFVTLGSTIVLGFWMWWWIIYKVLPQTVGLSEGKKQDFERSAWALLILASIASFMLLMYVIYFFNPP